MTFRNLQIHGHGGHRAFGWDTDRVALAGALARLGRTDGDVGAEDRDGSHDEAGGQYFRSHILLLENVWHLLRGGTSNRARRAFHKFIRPQFS